MAHRTCCFVQLIRQLLPLWMMLLLLLLSLASPSESFTLRPKQSRIRPPFSLQVSTGTSNTNVKNRSKKNTSPTISSSSSSSSLIEKEIVTKGRQGLTEEALSLYRSLPSPTVRQWNSAIDVCARAKPARLEEALRLFQTSNLRPNVFTFGALLSACARARNVEKAMELLNSMKSDYGVSPNAVIYSSVISACSRARPARWEDALQLLQQAEDAGVPMNVVGYNAALSACARAAQFDPAIQLLQRMEHPDAISYGTVMAACEKGRRWDLVLQHGNLMKEQNMTLDTLATTSVLHACQQLGLAEEAVQWLDFMKTSATPMKERRTAGWKRQGVRRPLEGPDAVAYRLAISACARGGQWEQGIQLLQELKQNCPDGGADVTAYTSAIAGCEYAGEWKKAFGLVDMMRKDGVEPNEVTMAAVLGACATACAKGGSGKDETESDDRNDDGDEESRENNRKLAYQKAMQLLRVMKNDASVVNPNIVVYNAAIRTCAEASELDMAFRLLDDAQAYGLEATLFTYGSLMTACERVESIDGVNRVFGLMRDAGVEPNEVIFGAAISCSRKVGDADRALLLLRKMIKNKLQPNLATFNTVLMAQTERRIPDLHKALLVLKLMVTGNAAGDASATADAAADDDSGDAAAGTPFQVRPNRQTYSLLIRAFASNGQPRGAEALLRRMQHEGIKPDVDLYTTTVTSYEKQRQPLRAVSLMESMERDGYDFYEIKVLNTAFKNAVKLVNAVGKTLREGEVEAEEKEEEKGEGDATDGDEWTKEIAIIE